MLTGFLLGTQFACVVISISCLYSSIKEEKARKANWKKVEDLIIELWGDLDGK